MNRSKPFLSALAIITTLTLASCSTSGPSNSTQPVSTPAESQQVPQWSQEDMQFFLHGSMSTEIVPESVLPAFIRTYPDIFPSADFSHLGAIADPAFGWPIGFTVASPAHLAGLQSVGINCASCHVADIQSSEQKVRVLGVTSHFDAEGFFSSIIGATFQTEVPSNMKRFLAEYLDQIHPQTDSRKLWERRRIFEKAWEIQSVKIGAAMKADSAGKNGAGPGGLQAINAADLELTDEMIETHVDLARLSVSMLKLFHNTRAALHVPDELPAQLPPPSGPGRNDAFGTLSLALFSTPQPPSPVKFGVVWNVGNRHWVHWDGNTQSPIVRNVLAAVGLCAPLIGDRAQMDFKLVQRHTDLTEKIQPPKYPFNIDKELADRGAALYQTNCAKCHEGPEDDQRLYTVQEVGTDPVRAVNFTPQQAALFNAFLAEVKTPGYAPSNEKGIRSTQKYWAPGMAGVWARSPYLHNGSVRTMSELLTQPTKRAAQFHRGSKIFDQTTMGFLDEGSFVLDTSKDANANTGHAYGTTLTATQKSELIEYLKTK